VCFDLSVSEWKTFGALLCPAQKPGTNSWFKANHLQTAGLFENNDATPLFATSECVHLWAQLDKMDRGVITLGAQGVGKSIIVWAWASHQAMQGKKSILSVHVDSAMFSSCTLLSATDCRLSNIEDPKELMELLHTLPLKSKLRSNATWTV
jgi:hypothetical protein